MKRLFHYFFVALITFSIATPSPAYTQTVQVSTSASLSQKVQEIEEFMQFKRILTVDQIFDFIDCLEDDEQTEMLTEQELDVVMRFVTFLARNGVLSNDQCDEFSFGVLPPPGSIPKAFSNTRQFTQAGKVLDRGGLTKAGRGLMKHGYREGSVYPKPIGSPEQINRQGQEILESIINHPERVIYERPHPDFEKVIEIVVPGKCGARFTAEKEMIGFLEP